MAHWPKEVSTSAWKPSFYNPNSSFMEFLDFRTYRFMGIGQKMTYWEFEWIWCQISKLEEYFNEVVDARRRFFIHELEPRIFAHHAGRIPCLELKAGRVFFLIAKAMEKAGGQDIDIGDIDLTDVITDKRQLMISLEPPRSSSYVDEVRLKAFEELKAKKDQKAKDDHAARLAYLQREKDQKTRARLLEQKEKVLAHRETRVNELFKFTTTPLNLPEGMFVEMMAEEPHAAQAEAGTFLVEETIVESVQQETIEEKKAGKELWPEDWEDEVVALDSDAEETRLPQTAGKTRSPSISEPHWQTWSERLDQANTTRALWQTEDSMLTKRPPQLQMADEGEEGVQLVPQQPLRSIPKITGYQRQPAFKLWIEEHDRKIAAGDIPKKHTFIEEGLTKERRGGDDDLIYYGQKYGREWDKLYGPERNYVYAEWVLRDPAIPSEPWQRTKDHRMWLHTKHRHVRINEDRLQKLEDIKEKQKKYMEKFRARETVDQERDRQKADRLRAQKNYEKNKLIEQKMPVRSKRSPSEQREARREAKRLAAEKRRRAEKAKDNAQEE